MWIRDVRSTPRARNKATEPFTKRQVLIYGDQSEVWPPEEKNLKGRLYQHYDEAGKVQIEGYDFKGNPLEKTRRMIKDDQAQPLFVHVVDWTGLDESILDTKTYNTTLAYDALNRVLGTLLPEDVNNHRTAVRPTYNRAGALRSVLVDEAPYLVDIAYNAKGQRLLMAMANGMMTRYAYDPLNFRLLRIRSEKFTMGSPVMYVPNGGVQQDLGYRYDLVGNIIGIRDKAPANGSAQGPGDLLKQFEYDPLKRLLTATGRESTAPASYPTWDAGVRGHDHTATNTYTRAYTYDKVGNVLEEQHTADGHPANSFTKTFNYHPTGADNRLVSYEVGGLTFPLTYDANGNQLKETTSRFHYWDHADLLRYFEVRAGTGAPSVWAHYFYDSAGTRVKKMVSKLVGGGIMHEVTVYIDGVFEETYVQTNGTIDPGRHYNTLHVMDGRSRIATIRIGNDAEDPTPAVKFNLEDHLRTSSVVLDQYGGLINREEYYPFGDTCFGAFAKKRYRYVGREKDSESGLYYYGARYYSSWTCRFVSVDPLAPKYPQLTPYNYAANDPIGDLDIDGMQNTKTPEGGGSGGSSAKQVPDQGGLPTFELGEVEVIGIKPPSAGPRIEASPTAAVAPLVLAAAVAEPLEAAVGTSVVEGYTYSEMLQSAGVAESPSGGGPNWLLRVGFTVGAILMPAGGTGAGSVPLQRPFRSEPNYDLMDTEHDPKSEFAYQDLEPSIAQPATESTSTPLTRYGESTATATEERFRFYATYTKTGVRSDGTTITYSGRTSGWTTNSTGPTREEAERAVALRDFGHHMTALGFGRAVLDKASLSRAAIRGREQQLIDHFGGAWKSDNGTSGNAIRAVSKYNLAGPAYHMAANALFGELHKYTGYRLFP